MTDKIIETLHCLVYDVPAETRAIYSRLSNIPADELKEDEKKTLERQRQIVRLRQGIAEKASGIGSMINMSVCLFPPENLEAAKSIKKEYDGEYKKINESAEIYILQFHQQSTLILKKKAHKSLKKRLDRLLDSMDKAQEKILKKEKKGITPKEMEKIEKSLDIVNDLAEKFKIEDEMSDILKIATERINGAKIA